uniref:Uncharacterized protein n=1 Tax=Melanopsichium pennsylvanicum 4 TaxID=1398559 RepID=A0A077QUR7_9BASI|nr:uncharacterized protein BN887_06129 [Melanopsichium pennsylvanicum 4]
MPVMTRSMEKIAMLVKKFEEASVKDRSGEEGKEQEKLERFKQKMWGKVTPMDEEELPRTEQRKLDMLEGPHDAAVKGLNEASTNADDRDKDFEEKKLIDINPKEH